MTGNAEPLNAQRILTTSRPRVIGCAGEVWDTVQSTMDTARRQALAGVPDGYVVIAEKQRSGRGRTGSWECTARQGILMSVVLRMGIARGERRLTGLMGAVAAAETAQTFAVQARIKWPNDIVVAEKKDNALCIRKLGGVLVEQAGDGDAAPTHILGIGLNVNQDHRALPPVEPQPTSLKIERGGRALDRELLCVRLIEKLDEWYAKLRAGYVEALLARWRTLCCLLGEKVRADVEGTIVTGTVTGLRATGELILQSDEGQEIVLSSERTTLLFGA